MQEDIWDKTTNVSHNKLSASFLVWKQLAIETLYDVVVDNSALKIVP